VTVKLTIEVKGLAKASRKVLGTSKEEITYIYIYINQGPVDF